MPRLPQNAKARRDCWGLIGLLMSHTVRTPGCAYATVTVPLQGKKESDLEPRGSKRLAYRKRRNALPGLRWTLTTGATSVASQAVWIATLRLESSLPI